MFKRAKRATYALLFFLKVVFFDRSFGFILRILVGMKKKDNVLIVIGGGIGDSVTASAVLKHYREYFAGEKIYLLSNIQNHAPEIFDGLFSSEIIEVSFYKLKTNLFYAWNVLAKLRKIGFEIVIYDITVGLPRLSPLFYALDAKHVYSYEGESFYLNKSRKDNFYIWFDNRVILPFVRRYFGSIISTIPEKSAGNLLASVIKNQCALLRGVTGRTFDDLKTSVSPVNEREIPQAITEIASKNFFLVAPGAGARHRWWPVERFAFVCRKILEKDRSLTPVIIGGGNEVELGKKLLELVPNSIDLTGKTDINSLKFIVQKGKFLICGDTSFVHIAIAMKKPTVCLVGWEEGRYSGYGYGGINRWIYNDCWMADYNQDWRYNAKISVDERMMSIPAEKVTTEVESLMDYLTERGNNIPTELFSF